MSYSTRKNKSYSVTKTLELKLLENSNSQIQSVVLADYGIVTDTHRVFAFRCNFETPSIRMKLQKMKDFLQTWVSLKKPFEESRQTSQRNYFSIGKQPAGTKRPEDCPTSKDLLTRMKENTLESTRTKTVGTFARPEMRSQVPIFSNFLKNWLVNAWSLTLVGLLRAGAKSKPHHCRESWKKEISYKIKSFM